jgi:hypothetical protein
MLFNLKEIVMEKVIIIKEIKGMNYIDYLLVIRIVVS